MNNFVMSPMSLLQTFIYSTSINNKTDFDFKFPMYFKSTGVSDKFAIISNKIFLNMIIWEPMF